MRGLVAVVGTAALASSAGAGPRARPTGQVVRIERRPRGLPGTPRFCAIQADPLTGASGQCYGPAPTTGETITVLDTQHVVATVRITSVTPYNDGGCTEGAQWIVAGTPITGQLSWQLSGGVIDVPIDPHAGRQLQIDHSPTGHGAGIDGSVIGIDGNGDGVAEVEFVSFQCDDSGSAASSNATSMCLEVWVPSGRSFERLRQDRIRNCF